MRQEADGHRSRWERFKEFDRWRSPYLVHQGAFIAAALVIFVLLRLVDVAPVAAFLIALVGGSVIESVVDRRWDRS